MFFSSHGDDLITDFEDNVDSPIFVGTEASDVQDALSIATQVGSDMVFDFGGGNKVTVSGIRLTALEDDIIVGFLDDVIF